VDVARVRSAPAKPLLVFDGDCNFCRFWIARWQRITGDRIDYLPFQDSAIAQRYPELSPSRFEQAVQLIETDGSVYGGAEAVFRALVYGMRWPLWLYQNLPGAAPTSEFLYKIVARNRTLFSFFTRLLWGRDPAPPSYVGARWLFLRSLGVVYVIAFVSLWVQLIGLVGHNGIMPADQVIAAMGRATDGLGWKRFIAEPTLCWFRSDDAFLILHCIAGTVLGISVFFGIVQRVSLFLLWALYLSLATICVEFLGFQWDNLLLEAGLLGIILAPGGLRPGTELTAPVSKTGLWLLRWLLFRLMFASGCVKLLSGDPTWRDLTALNYHYQTQPLPTWIAWYAHHFPPWWHNTSTVLMYAIEILLPFLIFMPRRLRVIACGAFILLQLSIAFTGNYGFFNLLTIVLCVVLLDDQGLRRLAPARFRAWFSRWRIRADEERSLALKPGESILFRAGRSMNRIFTVTVTVLILVVSTMLLLAMFRWPIHWPQPVVGLYSSTASFRSINNYGLFSVMTTNRPEIIVEGSNDGETWQAYEFKWKPGNLKRSPRFVAPHQPRLDWQMWFAALGDYRQNQWFMNFCYRLLQGKPEVISLLQTNPFPNAPPRYIRALVYDYKFTDGQSRSRDGAWWRREYKGEYCPTISLPSEVPPNRLLPGVVPPGP
jgi:predicted DCC family thiol-disulfide oxidoreductase YuxK